MDADERPPLLTQQEQQEQRSYAMGLQLVGAAFKGDLTRVRALIAAGADVRVTGRICSDQEEDYESDGEGGGGYHCVVASALMWAARKGNLAMVEALLAAGAGTHGHVNEISEDEKNALLFAAFNNHLSIVQALLRVPGIDVHNSSEALVHAAENGNTDMLLALLAAGANVNAADSRGSTALMWAVENQDMGMVRALLAAGAHVNAADSRGSTALTHAVVSHGSSSLDMVHALLEKGASINAAKRNRDTALILAAKQGKADIVRALLEWGSRTPEGVHVNAVGAEGQTALCEAAYRGHLDAVNALLGFHAGQVRRLARHCKHAAIAHFSTKEHVAIGFCNSLLSASGQGLSFDAGATTALSCAVLGGSLDVVRALLRQGAGHTVNVGAGASRPISLAADSGRLDMVRALLAVPGIDVANTPALIWAAHRDRVDVVNALLQAPGINVNLFAGNSEQTNYTGCSALMWAAVNGNPDMARALGQHPGVDVNLVCDQATRYTPLIMAASAGHLFVVQELVQLPGIAVNACSSASSDLYTALLWAARINHTDMGVALLAAGARADVACLVHARDGRVLSRTALVWAAMHNNLGMVRALLAAGARVHPEHLTYGQRGVPQSALFETTALVVAARKGNVEMVRELLAAARADPGRCRMMTRRAAGGGEEKGCALHGEPLRQAEEMMAVPEMVQLLREANQECRLAVASGVPLSSPVAPPPAAPAAEEVDTGCDDGEDPRQGNAKRRRYFEQ